MGRRDKKIPSFLGRTNARFRPNSHSPRLNETPTKLENFFKDKGIDIIVHPTSVGERIAEGFFKACILVVYLNAILILRFSFRPPFSPDFKHLVIIAGFIAYGWIVWRFSRGSSPFFRNVVMVANVSGAICFLGGFFGPGIFAPGPYRGSLLGIYFYGPAGFGLGGLGGAVYWLIRGPFDVFNFPGLHVEEKQQEGGRRR